MLTIYLHYRGIFNRDVYVDLADGGAHHFAETIRKIKQKLVHGLFYSYFLESATKLSFLQSSSYPSRSFDG